mmetsp:Transcript_12237/g.34749  ORF Transcript_12237/g.34749 Transcript_12237/m.34749 type:complete len:342 (-) Transcript_12237:185-1210(-)
MIQLGTTREIIKNAPAVQLKGTEVGFDGNRDGLVRGRLLQRNLVILWHILVSINRHHVATQSLHITLTVSFHVRIAALLVNAAVRKHKLKRKVHQAAVTPTVPRGITIDQHLLAEGLEFPRHNCIDALDRPRRRKCPATPAHALHLDGPHGPRIPPVHVLRQRISIHVRVHKPGPAILSSTPHTCKLAHPEPHHATPLLKPKVRKGIHAQTIAPAPRVMLDGVLQVVNPRLQTKHHLLRALVRPVRRPRPVCKHLPGIGTQRIRVHVHIRWPCERCIPHRERPLATPGRSNAHQPRETLPETGPQAALGGTSRVGRGIHGQDWNTPGRKFVRSQGSSQGRF